MAWFCELNLRRPPPGGMAGGVGVITWSDLAAWAQHTGRAPLRPHETHALDRLDILYRAAAYRAAERDRAKGAA